MYPWHLQRGIRPLLRDFPTDNSLRVFGADTETCKGEPLSLQISGPDSDFFSYTDRERIFPQFWSYMRENIRMGGVNICYFHNLNFDLRVLFSKYQIQMYEQFQDIKFKAEACGNTVEVALLFGKVNRAELSCGKLRLSIYCSMAFTQAGLAKSLKMFGVPTDKLARQDDLGKVRYDLLPDGDPEKAKFETYARQDAIAERALGLKILEFHREYKVRPAITLPSYASKVFRRYFLKPDDHIPFPPEEIVRAAEKSYHGGKNGFYLIGPDVLEDVYEIDINSAYPYAMHLIPPCTKGEYYRVESFSPKAAGIYCLSGKVLDGRYPLMYDHRFRVIPTDKQNRQRSNFEDVWVTGHEVARILKVPGNIRITKLWGYAWIPSPGANRPFGDFVEHFYKKKQATPRSNPYYHFYKIVLNALYGKLVSTIEVKSEEAGDEMQKLREAGVDIPQYVRLDERFDPVLGRKVSISKFWKAGGMYNPFWASQITGHTRAYLYDLERQYSAIHSATDSVKTKTPPTGSSGELGDYKVETFGRCYIFRNKLYLHYAKDSTYCGHKEPPYKYPSKIITRDPHNPRDTKLLPHPKEGQPLLAHDGQHLCKIAMHGYKGPLWVLHDSRDLLLQLKRLSYSYLHCIGLREGLKRKLKPCDFVLIDEVLDLEKNPQDDMHLLNFVLFHGGISLSASAGLSKKDLLRGLRGNSNMGELEPFTFKECGIRGIVNRFKGHTFDGMTEMAWEAGFLTNHDNNEFLDKLGWAVGGRKIYGTEFAVPQAEDEVEAADILGLEKPEGSWK